MMPTRVLIMGAAGRDFHNFNVCFRNDPRFEVVAFTATQIPNIEGRLYPPALAGPRYPHGIPIYDERELTHLIRELSVEQVVFAYSDVSHEYVMHKASEVLAAGADFRLIGPTASQLKSNKPVVSIGAGRTGSGKSQTTRHVCDVLQRLGKRVVAVRHPMPYGDLTRQIAQRFATHPDLDAHRCTIEEREEYEPHLERGVVVYAGVDYEAILRQAEQEADVVVWDGGNNDFPFFASDLHIVVLDPHRAGHELTYHPGETNLRMADVVVINKVDTANYENVLTVHAHVQSVNPRAVVIEAASPLFVDEPEAIRGRRVLVIEDGPTLTHGEMAYGAGVVAAQRFGAAELIDPRPLAVGSIRQTFEKYPHIGRLLPAMGYSAQQVAELQETIRRSNAELILVATPIDLRRLVHVEQPMQRVRYELQVIGAPTIEEILTRHFGQ
ncbi:MAG: cyclic 2,3-diphosphoglycerate synthase [Anaerolineae bacterium]|nr:cyclic 2,3-diphosphoglycerate synthase [Thermoflexales bacterium]MDW8408813.1 cyclic 2,3-diphosphoglycerate synthase [Anaerolineae bacterium]